VRLFSLFAAPPESVLEWSEAGVEGAWRFLGRVWRLVASWAPKITAAPETRAGDEVRQRVHATIKRVTDDMERFHFNTGIAAVMELVNLIYSTNSCDREALESVVLLLTPMAPHIAEELWKRLGHDDLAATHAWPGFDEGLAKRKLMPYPVQVNGKLRGQVEAEPEADQATVEALARALPSAMAHIDGKNVVKIVFVKGRLINFVVK
jgi:leucyl-tRNA synthetase